MYLFIGVFDNLSYCPHHKDYSYVKKKLSHTNLGFTLTNLG